MSQHLTAAEFNLLSNDEKSWHLWHGAEFLMAYRTDSHRVNLFHLNNYYIELWYNTTENRIDKIFAFRSLELLDPFLRYIELDAPVLK
ncbi:MAG: hypothetical protein ACK5C5_04525 [Bacteroidota bacterium]|jgi:hypothetical protein